MKVVVQRSKKSSVSVDGKLVSSIDKGLVLLVGFTEGDTEEKIVNISKLSKEEALKSIKYSSLLPYNPKGTMGLYNQFMKDMSEGLYNGYNLDGGLINNTLLKPLLNKNIDKFIVIATKHDYTLPDDIRSICNLDDIIIVRPNTIFNKYDTLRFEKEFCKKIYYEGYEIGKNLNISM